MGRKKRIKTRDYFMKRLIEGATKSGVHQDEKKQQNKLAARKELDEYEEDEVCLQCSFPLIYQNIDGFCSETCREYLDERTVPDADIDA